MDKRYIRLFENFYSDRASLVWEFGNLENHFEMKAQIPSIYQDVWHVIDYRVSECVIDICRFDESKKERIDHLEHESLYGWEYASSLVLDDSEFEDKIKNFYSNLGCIIGVIHGLECAAGSSYTEISSIEMRTEFENVFWKKASPKFKKAQKLFRELLSLMDDKISKIRSSFVKNKVPISLPHTPEHAMLPEEKAFYHQAKAVWDKEDYIDIEGNVNYLWVYVQELLANRNSASTESLIEKFMNLCERYYTETTFFISCNSYIEDLALERGDVKRYLDWSEMQRIYGQCTLSSHERVGIALHENIPLHPIDLIMATGGYYSKFIRDNYALYKVCLYQAFYRYDKKHGWFNLLQKLPKAEYSYAVQLYRGLPVVCESDVFTDFNASSELVTDTLTQVCKEAEKTAIEMKLSGRSRLIEYHQRLFEYLKGYLPQLSMFLEARPLFANGEIIPIYISYRDIAICKADVESKCDCAEVQRRKIRFVNIDLEPNAIVKEIKKLILT